MLPKTLLPENFRLIQGDCFQAMQDLPDASVDLVLDPFAGGGSIPVAALSEGRRVIAIEQDPAHIETIQQRTAFPQS